MAQVQSTEAEFQNYEENVREFLRANSKTLDRIYKEVNKSDTLMVRDVPRPSEEQVVKYIARDNIRPNILCEDATKEFFEIWSNALFNWFNMVYSHKGSNP